MGYSFRLAARVLLDAPSHRQNDPLEVDTERPTGGQYRMIYWRSIQNDPLEVDTERPTGGQYRMTHWRSIQNDPLEVNTQRPTKSVRWTNYFSSS